MEPFKEATCHSTLKPSSVKRPRTRATELREFFASLELPEGRLDTDALVGITDALAARPDLFEDLLVDDEVNRWWLQLFVDRELRGTPPHLGT